MIRLMMLAAATAISADSAIQRRIDLAPKAVRDLIERRAGCNYFAGEEPYDEARARDLARHMRSLRCTDLDRDDRELRQLFAKQPAILELLTNTEDVIY